MGKFRYVRYQAVEPTSRGTSAGVFGLVNGLRRAGRLTEEQESFCRTTGDWYNAAYTDPSTVDPAIYDRTINPGAAAWFKAGATHLLGRISPQVLIFMKGSFIHPGFRKGPFIDNARRVGALPSGGLDDFAGALHLRCMKVAFIKIN
ncbi:hypothetical protein [Lentzea sp. NPDC004782]|uniref:hypothetical protein n=1 Tax=Lentzea sp. NPDC004782 TaxID=3154458 RepID=UPI0033B61686